MTMNWLVVMFYAAAISILLTLVVIPRILHVSYAKRLFDRPDERKIHQGVVPRLGGFAFLPVMILTVGIILSFSYFASPVDTRGYPVEIDVFTSSIMVLLAAMTIMFLVGLYDDLLGLKYGMKFFGQLLAAVVLVGGGNYLSNYYGLFGMHYVSEGVGCIISCFLIVYVINSLNLIDGIDGLAAGLCIIGLTLYGITFYSSGAFVLSMLCWIAIGTLLVFWFFNVFGNKERHTKIFMGDIGSLSIGTLMSFMVIAVTGKSELRGICGTDPLILAFSPLVIPLFDVIRVFCIRIYHGKSPFLPDKRHIHHLILNAGMNMRSTMVFLLAVQIGIILLDIWLSSVMGINWILLINLGIYALGVWVVTTMATRMSNKNR